MEEEDGLGVEEDAVDVLVGARGVLGAGGHLERSEEARDEDFELLDILLLCLDHAEHQAMKGENRDPFVVNTKIVVNRFLCRFIIPYTFVSEA